ncbi:MAG TPA: hypothetical protein VLY83_04140, partial [Methanoregula sp.]|nr:hypothetical protein [Methanoregula sp.]
WFIHIHHRELNILRLVRPDFHPCGNLPPVPAQNTGFSEAGSNAIVLPETPDPRWLPLRQHD